MTRHVGELLREARMNALIPVEAMARHADTHSRYTPTTIALGNNLGVLTSNVAVRYLLDIEGTVEPTAEFIAWHCGLRLCCEHAGTGPVGPVTEAWHQPYHDHDDDRLKHLVRRRRAHVRWWWRLNRIPRRPGAVCLVCDTLMSTRRGREHGDPAVILEVMRHRLAHLGQLNSDPMAVAHLRPQDLRPAPPTMVAGR